MVLCEMGARGKPLHPLAPRPPVARFAALQPAKPHTPVQHTIFEYPLLRWVDVAGSKVAARPARRAARRPVHPRPAEKRGTCRVTCCR